MTASETARTIVVVTGASALAPAAVADLPADALVVAADGGLDHALAAGLHPRLLVGDLDSVSGAGHAWAAEHAQIISHPADKALTDTELALAAAAERQPERLVAVSGISEPIGRLDHLIAAVGALGGPLTAGVPNVDGWWGDQRVHIVRPGRPLRLSGEANTTFSVLALHGVCRGLTITGARWPLDEFTLDTVAGTGVSNEGTGEPVEIAVGDGVATVIIPPNPGGTP